MLNPIGAYFLTVIGVLVAMGVAYLIARSSHFYSAVIFLFVLWLILLGWQDYLTWREGVHLAHGHDQHNWLRFMNAAIENLQSEVWQVWLATLVFKHLIHVGSPESKEPQQARMTRIDRWISKR